MKAMQSLHLFHPPIPIIATASFFSFLASGWFWVGLVACVPAALLIRSYLSRRDPRALRWGVSVFVIAVLVWITPLLLPSSNTAPAIETATSSGPAMDTSTPLAKQAQQVMATRCNACHASHPTMMAGPPWGFNFDQPGKVDKLAADIYRQVVVRRAMPMGNVTHITEAERQVIARWYQAKQAARQKTR